LMVGSVRGCYGTAGRTLARQNPCLYTNIDFPPNSRRGRQPSGIARWTLETRAWRDRAPRGQRRVGVCKPIRRNAAGGPSAARGGSSSRRRVRR
jgi:hypothetical protein